MRKILLATTAFAAVAFAGAAQAASNGNTSPITVNLGGGVDFLAGMFHESAKSLSASDPAGTGRASNDFESLYNLNFNIVAKSNSGIEYGGVLTLDNRSDISNNFEGSSNGVQADQANIFMSGAFGKVVLGDSHGATDLNSAPPSVGEGQVFGHYIDFTDTTSFAKTFVLGIDNTDHSTNVTYFTPKVGNENNKVQLGVTYTPSFYNYGSSVTDVKSGTDGTGTSNTFSPYRDVVKGAIAYTGNLNPVTVGLNANVITGNSSQTAAGQTWIANAASGAKVRDFTAYTVGGQAAAEGFTVGVNYTDMGHYDTVGAQNKNQQEIGAGVKYEFNKVGVGVSYLGGEGYDNMLNPTAGGGVGSTQNYVKDFNSYGAGGTYTWAPGLSSNLDGVLFQQDTDLGKKNDGYVLLVSQKLAF